MALMPADTTTMAVLAGAVALAGVVRGFSGFGSALVFIPLATTVVAPWRAVIILLVVDGIMALPLLPRAVRECTWREVGPLALSAAVTVPVGAYFLVSVDPTALRWVLSALALSAVAVLASGWRYAGAPRPAVSAAVGGISGLLGGMASFYGPPIALFWLGGQSASATVRANLIVFLALATAAAALSFAAYDVFRLSAAIQALYLMPVYGLAAWGGVRLFGFASEPFFRRIAYLIISGSAITGAPLFDD